MGFSDSIFKKIENKTNVDKNTILSLANKLQNGNMRDENTLREVIETLADITGKNVSEEQEKKIIEKVLTGDVPDSVDSYINNID